MAENEDFGFRGAAGRRVGAKLRLARGVFVNCQLVFFVADTENNRVQEIVAIVGLSRPELEPSSLPQLPAPLSRQSQRGYTCTRLHRNDPRQQGRWVAPTRAVVAPAPTPDVKF